MKDKPQSEEKRNFFRRLFKKKADKKSISEQSTNDPSFLDNDAMVKNEDLVDDVKVTASHQGVNSVDEKPARSSEGVNHAASIAAVAAGVALAAPRPANAWVGDIVDGIVEKAGAAVLEPLKSLFGNLMEGFGLSNMFGTQEGAKAQGRSTDAINEVSHSVEQAKIMRATEPPPHLCLSIQEKKYQLKLLGEEKRQVMNSQANYFYEALKYGSGNHMFDIFSKVKEKAPSTGNVTSEEEVKTFLKVSPIIAESEDTLSQETYDNAILSVDTMVAGAAEKVGKPNLNATGKYAGQEAIKIGRQNRLAICKNTLVKGVAEKYAGNSGEASRYEARKLMVDRTFGAGTEWTQEVLSKGDPVPLLKDELVLLGTTNSLLLEMLEASKEANKLLALQVIEQIERA